MLRLYHIKGSCLLVCDTALGQRFSSVSKE